MGILTDLGAYPGVCSTNPSYLDFGASANKYAVGCLPEVDFDLPASWAGQLPIPNTTNDELFFWLFEAENQDLSDNLIIWLSGGPGCSSLDGLTKENGPLHFSADSAKPSANPYSWTSLANVLYIDQPVGSGYSGGSVEATLNAQVMQEFDAWLGAFYGVFPSLKSRNTFIMGESYAGIYIPYFTQALIRNNHSLPLNIKAIAIGDGTFGNTAALSDAGATAYMLQQNDILDIPEDIIDVFKKADQRCGFSSVLQQTTYPPTGEIKISGDPEGNNFRARSKRQTAPDKGCTPNPHTPALVNQSINACNADPAPSSACATFTTGLNYLSSTRPCFNPYNIVYNCTNTPNRTAFVTYLNKPSVRTAIHAPNKTYQDCNSTILSTLSQEYVVPPAYSIMPEIIDKGIKVHLYSGDYDYLLNHFGAELAIQNMTWGGKQGFRKKPDKKFVVEGEVMGNWGYERGLSYHHILRAGHAVPNDQPAAAFAFVRDFVIGDAGYDAA